MNNRLFLTIFILSFSFFVLPIYAQEGQIGKIASEEVLLAMSIEELMEVPIVFASSKRLQPITEAASSVEIVTAEDIKRSGATNIADALRKLAGVQVRETSVSSHAIGVRGFADSQHVLITLDGSSAYLHHVNHTYVDFIPVALEEIERIEVIKGPGGIFFGGSAFSGVVNIVTKTPKQIGGTNVNLFAGNWDTFRGSIIHGGSKNKLDYSFSAGRFQSDYMSPPRDFFMHPDTTTDFGTGRIIYHLNDKSSVSADLRHSYSDDGISRHCSDIKNTYVTLRYDQSNFWMRYFHNKQHKDAVESFIVVDDTNDEFEIMRIFKWGKNIFSVGGFARKVDFDVRDETGNRHESDTENYALKAENEYHATDRIILTLGGRLDHFSEIDWVGLGRGSVIYKPVQNQRVALTVAQGYYLPSLAQLYGWGGILLDEFNPDLDEERITSYELAYYGAIGKRVKLNSAIFYNDYEGLISNNLAEIPTNSVDGDKYGLELSVDFVITSWLNAFATYTYQTTDRTDFGDLEIDPENMVNAGLQMTRNRWTADITLHYVDDYFETLDVANPALGRLEEPQLVESYTTVDARIAYQPKENVEIALSALNLFDEEHVETNPIGWIGADEVGRRILASVSCSF